jgi:alpha-galactosidase
MKQMQIPGYRSVLSIFLWLVTVSTAFSQTVSYELHHDGSFDIRGSSVSLLNCYPSMDGLSVRPLSIESNNGTDRSTLEYTLSTGSMELIFRREGNSISIETVVRGAVAVCKTISPIGKAQTTGADRFYRTPAGIAGDAGIHDWPTEKIRETSHSITGLIPGTGKTLVISTRDYRKFFSTTELYPPGLLEGRKSIDVTIHTEMVSPDTLPRIFITENEPAQAAMREEAVRAAREMSVPAPKQQTYHWCSWYYAYYYLTEKMLSDYIDGFNSVKPRVPVQTIQIDVGYFPHVGDWLGNNTNFPNGLRPAVKKILENGYRAGIWIAPYMVGCRSKLYEEHPDWVLRNRDNSMAHQIEFYEENRLWGAMDEEYYLLDTSNPAVMEYLRKVFRSFREMGITFFKTDFMNWGNKASHTVKRYAPGKTSAEYQRDLLKMIREEIGPESFWLGCISNYAPMIGFADAMRISWDIGANWSYAQNFFQEVQGQQYFNNVWWQNDPDAIILRSAYNHMSENEVESLALYMGMLGGAVNTSDLFHTLPEKNLAIFRLLEPGEQKNTATFPFLGKPSASTVLVRELIPGQGWAVLFFNKTDAPTTELIKIPDLIGRQKAFCFYWDTKGSEMIGERSELLIRLDPRQSRLVYVSLDGKAPNDINFAGKPLTGTKEKH